MPSDIQLDPHQQAVADALQQLKSIIENEKPQGLSLGRIFGNQAFSKIKGLYVHGGVGRGKTMLMDAFYNSVQIDKKQRWHFHAFMQHIHQSLNQIRKNKNDRNPDRPAVQLAKKIAKQNRLLCFDEFHVTDIADAMILGRLFKTIFEQGTILVATSNFHPDELYPGGLHRDRFLPFIDLLKFYAPEVELDGDHDYRTSILNKHPRYMCPADAKAHKEMNRIFEELSLGDAPVSHDIDVNGRSLSLTKTAKGVTQCSFAELCETPLSVADYLALCDHHHTLLLEDVPILDSEREDEAKRFISLIDVLYDRSIHLVVSAQALPGSLYQGKRNKDLFKRTVSRLNEMTSAKS